jgi:hypothetical protein
MSTVVILAALTAFISSSRLFFVFSIVDLKKTTGRESNHHANNQEDLFVQNVSACQFDDCKIHNNSTSKFINVCIATGVALQA